MFAKWELSWKKQLRTLNVCHEEYDRWIKSSAFGHLWWPTYATFGGIQKVCCSLWRLLRKEIRLVIFICCISVLVASIMELWPCVRAYLKVPGQAWQNVCLLTCYIGFCPSSELSISELMQLAQCFDHYPKCHWNWLSELCVGQSVVVSEGHWYLEYNAVSCSLILGNSKKFWEVKLTLWRQFFQILAHPVFKMWVIQKPNKVALWNKWHFEEKEMEIIHHV